MPIRLFLPYYGNYDDDDDDVDVDEEHVCGQEDLRPCSSDIRAHLFFCHAATSEFSASGSSHSSISEDLDTPDQLACIWRFLKWGRIDIGESESQIGDIEECPPEITKGLRYFVFVFVYA